MHDRLTRSDIQKMEAEIEHRKLVVRPQALDDLKEARSHGDLSENFEYYAAKRFKNQNESRIRYLTNMIRTAVIISDASAEDEVGLNNAVTIEFIEDGAKETYRLVTSVRASSLEGLITPQAPLGKAIMGKKVGDVVSVQVNPSYSYSVKILEINKMTTDEDDKIRSF
ncbi:MAG: transcription elongation factor GreA [Clostridium sp.]|nr:transcription elongation factor GreA [Clostridium sp.]